MALEVELAGGDVDKYNPYSPFVNYAGAAAVWASLSSGQVQPACPAPATGTGSDLEIVHAHLDEYLAFTRAKQPFWATLTGDPDFFGFENRIVDEGNPRADKMAPYGNSLMIIYLVARADDLVNNMPHAACYLDAAVATGNTLIRLMKAEGYDPTLGSPPLRLGTFDGLYNRYPAEIGGGPGFPPFGAPGDLGNAGCECTFRSNLMPSCFP